MIPQPGKKKASIATREQLGTQVSAEDVAEIEHLFEVFLANPQRQEMMMPAKYNSHARKYMHSYAEKFGLKHITATVRRVIDSGDGVAVAFLISENSNTRLENANKLLNLENFTIQDEKNSLTQKTNVSD
jgi:hypothetical protein